MLTAEQALNTVTRLHSTLTDRAIEVQKLDAAYRGKQPLRFLTEKWAEYHAKRYKDFSDNWCGVVGNSPSERLRVTGFRLGTDVDAMSDDEAELFGYWDRNEMDTQSSQGFLSSIVSKRSSVLVWGDENDDPLISWEHPGQVIVDYDPERPRRRVAALKTWCDGSEEYATLYTADAVFKYERKTSVKVTNSRTESGLHVVGVANYGQDSGWQVREVTGETWPLANPLGEVPVVEFPNRPMLGGDPMSDIEGTMAMQDAINLLWAYMFNAADFASMPARVVMGQEPPKLPILDEAGNKIGEKAVDLKKLAEDRILWLTGANAKIGQWDAAKLDVFTNVIEVAVGHIAAQTRTPPHYLATNKGLSNLSGDALVAAETGLVKKVEEQQLFFGPAIREVFRLTALVKGDKRTAEACRTGRVQWKDAETRSDAQAADAALKWTTIGVPLEFVLEKKLGLSQPEIKRVMDMHAAQAADPTLEAIARTLTDPTAKPASDPAVDG